MRPPRLRRQIDEAVAQPWPDECVLFDGRRQPNGYGRVSIDGQYRRAHVYACEQAHGSKPSHRHEVGHSCGERMCINPRHLRWLTRAENEADKVRHGRSNRGGQRSGAARLTEQQVIDIRRRYERGGVTQQQLAAFYGVHIMTINNVINRRNWRYLE